MKNKFVKIILTLVVAVTLLPMSSLYVKADNNFVIIDDVDSRFEYSEGAANFGGWSSWSDGSGKPEVTEHWSNSAGATIKIKFNGTKFELFGKADPTHAKFSVSIDGGEPVVCDAYAASKQLEKKLYESEILEAKEHVAVVTVLKERNPNAKPTGESVYGVQFVYAKVYTEAKEEFKGYSIVEDMDVTTSEELFKVKYIGSWSGGGTSYPDAFHDGYEHYADNGNAFEMKFIGSKVELWASKDPKHGIYNVTIDGEDAGVANATASSRQNQQLIYTSPELEDREHIIKVELKDQPSMSIQLDYLKVYHNEIMPTEIKLSDNQVNIESGMSQKVSAQVLPSVAFKKEIEWSSADERIATVDKDGTITAMSPKTAQTLVSATIKGTNIKADVIVNVIPEVRYLSAFVGNEDKLETQENYQELLKGSDTQFTDIAWKGDVLNSKIVAVSRNNEVTGVEVTASDFTNGEAIINASNVDIKWLKEVKANIGRGQSGAPKKDFPDVIYKGGKIDIEAKKVKFAWVNINIPENAKPGTYKGTVTLDANELDVPYTFNYEFEVVDLVQPKNEEVGTEIQVWQHPFSVANYYLGLGENPSGGISNELKEDFYFTAEHFNLMRSSMKEYAEIGGRDVVANIVEEAWNHQSYYNDPSMVKWTKKKDGSWDFNYEWYDAWINFQIECGVIDPTINLGQIKCYSIVPWNNQIAYFDEETGKMIKKSFSPGAQDWQEIWTTFLSDFRNHSQEKGWFDITYIAMDERGLDQLTPAVDLIESVKGSDGESFKISSAFNFNNTSSYDFTDRIHDLSINLGNVDKSVNKATHELSTHRKELGLLTTIYTCTGDYPGNYTISDPADNNWVMWYTLTQNTDGFMRWAWDNWTYDPLIDVSYRYWEPGDGWYIYPMERSEVKEDYSAGFYSTPRYEMMKKGIRDINKAKYLMQNDAQLNVEITALVDSLKVPRKGNSYGSAVAADDTQRELLFKEVNRMHDTVLEMSKAFEGQQIDNKAELKVEIKKAEALREENYTTSTWKAVADKLAAAKVVLADADATVAEIQTATVALNTAMTGLERKVTPYVYEAIKANVAEFKALEADYTAAEFADMKAAITAAETLLKKDVEDISAKAANTVNGNLLLARLALKDYGTSDALFENLKLVIEIANDLLASDEVADVRPEQLTTLKTEVVAGQALIDANSKDRLALKTAVVKITKATQELYKIVDKTSLESLVVSAETEKAKDIYTAASVAKLDAAITEAKAVIANDNATEKEVSDAYAKLEKAIKGLVVEESVDKGSLANQIDIANSIMANKDKYIASTIAGLDKILADAIAVFENEKATQAEVNAATKALTAANMKARVKADKEALADIIAKANAIDLSKYTVESAINLRKALLDGQKILSDENATQEQVDASVKAIQTAMKGLTKPTTGGTGTGDTTNTLIWFVLLAGSLAALSVQKKLRRK